MNKKRYALFHGWYYHPDGGWHDFVDAYETTNETETKILELKQKEPSPPGSGPSQWWQVVDLETFEFKSGSF